MANLPQGLKDYLFPAITVATAGFVAYSNYNKTIIDQELQRRLGELDMQVKASADARANTIAERDFMLKTFEIVRESIELEDTLQQDIARQFVITMIEGELRDKLLVIFELAGTPEIQTQTAAIRVKEEQFAQQNSEIVAGQVSPAPMQMQMEKDWDYDVFWCEAGGTDAQRQAELIRARLTERMPAGSTSRIRVRELPVTVNASPGYHVSGYQIRRSPDESVEAGKLKTLADGVLAENGFKGGFVELDTAQVTRWYISAFVCPG